MGLCGQPANCLNNKRRSTRGGGASRCSLAEQKTVVSIEWRDIDNVSESFLDGTSSEIYSNNNNASSPTTATAAAAAAAVDKIVGEVDDSKFLSSMTQMDLKESMKGQQLQLLSSSLHHKRRLWQAKRDRFGLLDPLRNPQRTITKLTLAVETAPSSNAIEEIMMKSGLKCSPRELNTILSALKDTERSVEFFEWMRSRGKTKANTHAYNFMCKILVQRQAWSRIDVLLKEMVEDDCKPDDFTYNMLIQFVGKARYPQHATKYFHEMLHMGVTPNRQTYSMIMMLYQKFGKLVEAEFVYQHMMQSGFISCTACSAMLTLYTRGGLYEKAEQVIQDMQVKGVAPDRDNWLKQLNAYGQQGKVKQAELVMFAMQEAGMTLGIVGYNSMITAYGKANRYESAVVLFDKLKEAGLQPDEVTYSCMIGACGREGKLKDALIYFEGMKARGICPSLSNFNTLINLHGKSRNVVGVVRVLSDMKKLGCRPDSHTLDAAVKAFERAGKSKKVMQVLTLLRDAGWFPSVACYGTLLHIYLKCSMQQEALQTFYALRKVEVAPKEYMCRSLICLCKESGMYDEAVKVFTEMQAAGVMPSMESSCTIMNVYSLMGEVAEAEALFNNLRQSRQKLDKIAYNVMINVYMRAGMNEEATSLFNIMEEQDDLVPDSYTFHSMLRLYQKCNMPLEAEKVYWRMVNAGIELDEVMCNCVINCCGRVLPLEETSRIFQDMIGMGFCANNITFNVMIDLYGKAGMLDRARNALKLAQSQGAADKISFSTLINAYGKRHDFPKMEATLWEMQNAGLGGSLEAFNSMLDSYGKAGLLDKLEDVLERMKKAGCRRDLSTYNILINIYGRNNQLGKMADIFQEMHDEGLQPDRWTYNTIIRTYGCADLPDQAVKTFKEMQDADIMPDRVTYINLIGAFEKTGNLLEAARWSLWMTQAGYSK
jgi:pentatricopeptide repeat protein